MACSTASSTEKSERDISDAVNHLVCGKRHLLVNDYVSAVTSLQEACQLFSKQYGETANECAEPYLYYGKALLEFSRMETGVLGNALQGVNPDEEEDEDDDEESEEDEGEGDKEEQVENPDKVTGEEREQIIQQVEAALDENSRELDQKMEEMDEESATGGEESESTGEKSQDEGAAPDGDEAGPSTSSGATKDEEEDVSNLQLAWEMLELAKLIFKRQAETDKTKELRVAEVLLKLGEVSIESENYQQASEDLQECLSIQKKHLTSYDRAIAETLYQLGLAHSFNNQFEGAIESFTNSMRVIEERIAVLKQSEENNSKSQDKKPDVPNNSESSNTDAKEASADKEAQDKENVCVDKDNSESIKKEESEKVKDNESSSSSEEKATESEIKKESEESNKNEKPASPEEVSDDPWLDTKREIEELEGLIPDIKIKIEDTEDMMKNALNSIKEAALQRLAENSEELAPPPPLNSEEKAKPISNISHLVKRKRKSEEESSTVETNDLKKPRPSEELEENHVNGDTVLNGDSKPMETEESPKVKTANMETQPEAEPSVA